MPTIARRPAAQQERQQLQARRLHAAELFAAGVRQAEVARQFGVSRQSVHLWYQRWQAAGPDALRSQGPTGPAPRLSDSQLRWVEQALLKGAGANGFVGELWTLDRIAIVIERLTGVCHHPAWVWALLHHRLGWSVQRPVRRAAEGDQVAIERWSRSAGRGFCKRPTTQSLPGLLRRVRAQPDPQCPPQLGAARPTTGAGAPVQLEEGLDGGGAVLWRAGRRGATGLPHHGWQLRHRHPDPGAGRAAPLPGGERATLLWDGLPAHRSNAMRAWLATQRSWLVVERLPAYAPELNPVEGLWSWLKGSQLANLVCPTLQEVVAQAELGTERARRTPHLAYSFLRRTGLSVS
jgi:transposase